MTERVSRLGRWLITGEVRWRQNRQIAAIYRSFRVILPLVVLGTLADFVNQAWLEPTGYYYRTLHVTDWLLQRVRLQQITLLLQAGAFGMATLGAAFVVAYQLVATATPQTNDRLTAGFVGVLGLELINVNPLTLAVTRPIQWVAMDLGLRSLVLGLLMGLIVGNAYRWGVLRWRQPENDLVRPMTFSLVGMLVAAGVAAYWLMRQPFSLHATFMAIMRAPLQLTNDVWRLIDFSILNGLFAWGGSLGPIPSSGSQSLVAGENLAAVLTTSGWHLPHPLTEQTVIQTYVNMGGPGMTLGLLVAIFLGRRNAAQRRIGWLSLVPVLGNFNAPLLLGLPVVLSPILGIPLLLAPVACIGTSCLFLGLHWVPATAYPLLTGTPGPLLAFLGTSGAWTPVLLAGVNLVLSTAIYYPFVKWANLADRLVKQGEAS
ncbi:PTS transporter subunit EIIC [Levilactobacillus namurensis]|uniref:PTS transporter subunit EIIC n=1 Tax=Levilactobacillus namurensis TaxID=380393 RepID=UPI0026E95D7B|nr:PTS transporter subunit EIIC [Levilactobacillus namurensis]